MFYFIIDDKEITPNEFQDYYAKSNSICHYNGIINQSRCTLSNLKYYDYKSNKTLKILLFFFFKYLILNYITNRFK